MMLAAEDLAFGHGRRIAGRDVGFALRPGRVLCLLGPNGGGKTTLLRTALGLLPPLGGRVTIDGASIAGWPRRRVAAALSYVPQGQGAFFPFTVRQIVLMGRAAHIGLFATPSAADRSAADSALARLGIEALAERPYTEISGGERQLVLIARALAQESRLILMDEPTSSLDPANSYRVLAEVRALASSGLGILLTTHDPNQAFLVADEVLLLRDGRTVAMGPPDTTLTPDNLEALYGVALDVVPIGVPPGRITLPSPRSFPTLHGGHDETQRP